jgi:photosystem II stability/assembly factor-like uncharacterized protein
MKNELFRRTILLLNYIYTSSLPGSLCLTFYHFIMKKRQSLLVSLFLFANFTLISQTTWEVLNPKPSYLTGMDIHFISDNKGFIINEYELLETDDAGATWYVRQSLSGANDIDFYDSTGFIAGYYGFGLRTTDAGNTWVEISTGTFNDINTVNVINEDTIILSTAHQLIKSFNAGNDWQALDIPDETVIKTYFFSNQVGVAVCAQGIIIKTVNGGQDWYITNEVTTSPSDFFTVSFVNENVGFASRQPSTVLKTTDGGETWTILTGLSLECYSIRFINENTGYVAGEEGAMYKTINGGISWSWVSFQDFFYYSSSIYGMYFTDENHGYATGDRGRIVKTNDGGSSWDGYSPVYDYIKQIQFVNNDKGYFVVGNDFYRTINGGNTWEYQGSTAHYNYSNGFQFTDENIGYSIGGGSTGLSGTVFKTMDGGVNWTIMNGGDEVITNAIASIYFTDENTGLVSGGDKTMKTTDGGETWTQVSDIAFKQIQFVNDTLGFARTTGYTSRIYKTTDAGENWEVSFEIEEGINSFDFVNENVGYLTGDNGLFYKTTDGGTNWSELDIDWEYYVSVDFYNADTGYLINENGEIDYTEDGGQSWYWDISVYGIENIEYSKSNVYLYGTYGKILKGHVTGDLGTHEYSFPGPYIQLTPNPADDYLKINALTETNILSVEIFDIQGRLILDRTGLFNHSAEINLDGIDSGVYFVRILMENDKAVVKKIVIR